MVRVSILLPEVLHQQLIIASKGEGKSLSVLIRELLSGSLAKQAADKNKRVYRALREMDGIGGDKITDASATIDEVLYGTHGV